MAETAGGRGAVCGVLAPDFTLRDVARAADAAPLRLRALRQWRPALLALLPVVAGARNADWLRALMERTADLAYAGAAVLVVAPEAEARRLLGVADVTFPLLADPDGATLVAYLGAGASLPALAVIDRYSQLAALLAAPAPDTTPDLDAALRELAFADQQDCACGLPAWEV